MPISKTTGKSRQHNHAKGQKDKQRSTKHYIENKRSGTTKLTKTVNNINSCTCYCSLTLNLIKSPCQMPIKNYFGHITYISHVLLLYLFKQTHPSDSFKLVAGCGSEKFQSTVQYMIMDSRFTIIIC
jgi:hypothetical protein